MRRNIELLVQEPTPGNFVWVLLGREVFGKPREVLDHAHSALSTHRQATEAGVIALRRRLEPTEPQTADTSH